jgi:ketosteroid isomerase-like protein
VRRGRDADRRANHNNEQARIVSLIAQFRWSPRWLLALALLVPTPYVVCRAAPTEVPATGPLDVMAVDRDLALLAVESGIRAAYHRYLAVDAVWFRPLPVRAREWLATHEPATGRLEWVPAAARIACDASFAVTLGTWSYTAKDSQKADTGQYLTAWRRAEDGEWRIALDQSLSLAALPASSVHASGPCDGANPTHDKLLAADRKLNGGLRNLHADDAPAIEVRAATRGSVTGTTLADLALTHGEFIDKRTAPGAEPQVRAVYVRVWQRDGRKWRVLHDFVSPVTP